MNSYPYHIYYPNEYRERPEKKWPLLIFLHGAGERGNEINKVKTQGLPQYLQDRQEFPFVVAYPQCPLNTYWQIPLLNVWLVEILSKVRADHSRIYLTGISMGGYGTWRWAAQHPEKFAAIIPICGGGDPARADRLIHMPIWAFHGGKDDIVPLSETVKMVDAVKASGGKVVLTVYPDLYHDSWTATYHNPKIYNWLLKFRK
jgi:predicted peptidase